MSNLATAEYHLRRGLEHEDEDYERTVQKLVDQDLEDWPNDAGVSSTLDIATSILSQLTGCICSSRV